MKNTSINLHWKIVFEIDELAQASGISKSEIIRKLIEKIEKFYGLEKSGGKLVEYQERLSKFDENGEMIVTYEKVHFSIDENMIDYTKLLRFNYRISLSKLVAASFFSFWEEIVEEVLGIERKIKKLIDSYESIKEYFRDLLKYLVEKLNTNEIKEIKRE